jgi:hypothetical protein
VTAASAAITLTVASAPTASAAFNGPNAVLTWVVPSVGATQLPLVEYEVRYGNVSWAASTVVGRVKGTTFSLLAQWTGSRTFRVAAVDTLGLVGAEGVVGMVVTAPVAPTLVAQVVDNNVLLTWNLVAGTLPTDTYEVRKGATWAAAAVIGTKNGGFTSVFETAAGVFTYWVAAIDTAGNYGTPASVATAVNQPPDYVLKADFDSVLSGFGFSDLTVYNAPSATDRNAGVTGSGNTMTRDSAANNWKSVRAANSIRKGVMYWETLCTGNTMVGIANSTPTYVGTNNYAGIDLNSWGYNGADGLLYRNGTGSAYGATFTTGDVIGTKLDMEAGTLTFYKNGVGQGIAVSGLAAFYFPVFGCYSPSSAQVSNFGASPWLKAVPDLYNGKHNAALSSGALTLPLNIVETFQEHFVNNAWATPQAQVTASFPYFAQPSLASGYYEEIFDYGTVLAANKITVTPNVAAVVGVCTTSVDISVSSDSVTWTTYTGVTQVFATSFRYVKYRVTVTRSASTDFAQLLGVNLRLDSKLKTSTGTVACVSTDTGGTIVYLTDTKLVGGVKTFIDVDAIQITPLGTTSITAVYDFVDAPDPLSLKVLLFNSTTGARVSGTASYTIRGF